MTPKEFAETYGPAAVQAGEQLNVNPTAILTQWASETGWGKGIPGKNNLGNIKDFSGGGTAAKDSQLGTIDKYRDYESLDDFVKDYINVIKKVHPYATGSKEKPITRVEDFGKGLQRTKYAEDKRYVPKLVATSNAFKDIEIPTGKEPKDPLEAEILGMPFANEATSSAVAPSNPHEAEILGVNYNPPTNPNVEQPTNNVLSTAKNTASNLVNPEFLAKDIAAKADLAYGVVPGMVNFVGTPIAKLANLTGQGINAVTSEQTVNPQIGTQSLNQLTNTMQNPIGKAFGITEDPTYKNEATTKIINTIGQYADKPISYIAEKTGLPKEDIAWYANAAGIKLAPVVAKGGKAVSGTLQDAFARAKPGVTLGLPEAEVTVGDITPDIPTHIVKEVDVPRTVGDLTDAEFEEWRKDNNKDFGTTKAFRLVENPEHPDFGGKPKRNTAILDENPSIPQNVNSISNQKILEDIGVERFRNSALENNYKEASSQYITSKADNGPYAKGIAEQIQHEKDALTNHFGGIESELGGTVPRKGTSFEISDEMERGKNIKTDLEEAQQAHQEKTTQLYNQASQEVGAVPVELGTLKEYLDKNSNFVHAPEKSLRKGVNDYLSEQGLLDEHGEIKPMTVGQSEQLRKFINKQYNFETKGKVGDLVNTIDDDVFKNVQGKTYEDARAHFKAGKEIYNNPKAIKDLLSDEGINQKIADEKVINKILSIDESQFGHLINTLKETGKTKAISEIQTALVNRLKEAGKSEIGEPFNVRAAAKERAKLSNKLNTAFADNPELLDKIDKGIEAGNILYIPTKYPGAAVQTNLLKNKFSEIALQKAGTTIGAGVGGVFGGAIGGAVGAAGGELLGNKGANALRSGRQAKQLKKEIKTSGTKISDIGNK
jgi:F0F1-type ATP synthase delta subunit